MKRYLESQVKQDLKKKMVFLGGPRQVGKTFFSTHLAPPEKFTYLNWDVEEDRKNILDRELGTSRMIILDELHKYRKWRSLLKSLYDAGQVSAEKKRNILVTGSARLDLYRFGGDSLQGRYYYLRLLPFTVAELAGQATQTLEALFAYSGFPEPFLSQSEKETKRWSREYQARVVRDDIRSLEQIQDLGTCELLLGRLPECIGSPLSINNLREDLGVAFKTVKTWISIYERLYVLFRLAPMGGTKIRAVKKEQKAYLYNWTPIQSEGARFENLVAVHLLKYVYWLQDTEGRNVELRYFRDTDGREVDFVIEENGKPILFIEPKLSDEPLSLHLRYLSVKYPNVPAYQISLRGKKDYLSPEGIRIQPAAQLLETLI